MRIPITILLLTMVAAGLADPRLEAQTWAEYRTDIPLPTRDVAHPLELLATSDGRLVLAWISGADGRGALYTAIFADAKWSKPCKVLDLGHPCRFVLFEQSGRPHLLECGSGRHFFAALEADAWKPRPYPLPRGAALPAVAAGPGKNVSIVFVAPIKRVSRTPRAGALYDVAGKVFLLDLADQGEATKTVGLDPTSQSRASNPVVAVDPAGQVHVLMERRYGRGAKPNIGYVNPKEPKSARRVSRQPGDHPALAALSERELVALWNDRPGVVQCIFDGRAWNPPTVLVPKASDPHLSAGRDGRLHLTVFTTAHSLYYLTRGPRGWSTPIDFGSAAGSGRAVEAQDGTVHLIWEHGGTFHHRAGRPAGEKPAGKGGG